MQTCGVALEVQSGDWATELGDGAGRWNGAMERAALELLMERIGL